MIMTSGDQEPATGLISPLPTPTRSAEFRRRSWRNYLRSPSAYRQHGIQAGLGECLPQGGGSLAWTRALPPRISGNGNQRDNLRELAGALPNLRFLPLASEFHMSRRTVLVNERPGVAHRCWAPTRTSAPGKPASQGPPMPATTAQEPSPPERESASRRIVPDLLVAESLRLGGDKELAEHFGELGRRYCLKLLSEQGALERLRSNGSRAAAARRGAGSGKQACADDRHYRRWPALVRCCLAGGCEVHGMVRRASTFNTRRIDHLYVDPTTNPMPGFSWSTARMDACCCRWLKSSRSEVMALAANPTCG